MKPETYLQTGQAGSARHRHSADLMFTFLLLIAFTMFSLMLAGIGAAVYQKSTKQLNENFTSRTAVAYVSEKIRQSNRNGCISSGEIEGIDALILLSEGSEESSGDTFLTYIYFWNGSLRELFVREGTDVTASMGTSLVELNDFSFSVDGNLLYVSAVSPEGNTISAYQRLTIS